MDLIYFCFHALCVFSLIYIYLEKKLNQQEILCLFGQVLCYITLLNTVKNYPYITFTVHVFVYLIMILTVNRKLLLKDIMFTFSCILIQQISLLILISIHIPLSYYISCFVLLFIGFLFIRLLRSYELDIDIKQWWHFIVIGYIQSLSLYCLVLSYLHDLKIEFLFLIFAFVIISVLYIYLFITIIKENQIKIDYEKNNLRRIHKNELNNIYYDIHNKEHQLYYIAYSIQNNIENNNSEAALKTIQHYIQSLDKTQYIIYSDYSYFNIKFTQLINTYKNKNVDIIVYINSIQNNLFNNKEFINNLYLLIENFIVTFYNQQPIYIQITQENKFTCLSLYTNTSIINNDFIQKQKMLSLYSYSFENKNFTILKIIF